MKFQAIVIASLVIAIHAQGWQFNPFFGGQSPPGLQFNPVFNGQNPNSNIPARNFSRYPPFITNYAQMNNSNPLFNYWSNVPFFSYFSAGRSITKRDVGAPRYYYNQPGFCIPDYPHCNGSHSLSIGCLAPGDRPLFRQSYVKSGNWFSRREKIVRYPGDFLPPGFGRNETITAIKILDRKCDGTGGYAQITQGGVGQCTATIRMFSTGARQGFSFYVQIFGRQTGRC